MSTASMSAGWSASQRVIAKSGARTGTQQIWPLVLMLYASLLPNEVHIVLGGQYIYSSRVAAIVSLPWLMVQFIKGGFRFHFADAGILLGGIWMILSFGIYYGTMADAMRAATLAFDMVVPYLVARSAIHSTTDLRRALICFAPGIFIAGSMVMLESVSHVAIVKPLATAIFGKLPLFSAGGEAALGRDYGEFRFGLLRASGSFPHPILAGLFLVSSMTMYGFSGIRGWPIILGVLAGLGCFFTVSSTAFLSFALFIAILVYDRLMKRTSFLHWRLTLLVVAVALLVVQLGSKNGIISIVGRFALDPQTAFYRGLIWDYGSLSVGKHPWFGIGFTAYERLPWMVESIDNQWMLLAVRHGFIEPFFIGSTVVTAFALLCVNSVKQPEVDRRLFVGVATSLFIMSLLIFTVALFGGFTAWYYSVIGMALSLAISSVPRKH